MDLSKVGIDVVRISRIEKIHDRFGYKFLQKVFNPWEIEYLHNKNLKTESIATMFSFKESISKAMGTGICKNLGFKDIKIFHTEEGAPYGLVGEDEFFLSNSHDGEYTITFALKDTSKIKLGKNDIKKIYKKRPDNGHKGTFGRTMIIASSPGMIGSGYLSSLAALRSGSGLVYHYIDDLSELKIPLSIKHTEVILKWSNPLKDIMSMDSVLFGPGVGVTREKRALLNDLLSKEIKLVIDADGINMLAEDTSGLIIKKADLILTPHILEFSRLVGELVVPGDKLYRRAKDFAKFYNLVLVLKDSKTYITNGEKEYILDRENSGLATAGSGDVLSGIIVSLLGQGYDSFSAAVMGAEIHSLAGQLAAEKNSKTSMIASDILDNLKYVFKNLEGR